MKRETNIFTFYSYKGGVGRSKALANIGAQLARWGYKTLLIDWDLEAPGLEDYFKLFLNKHPNKKYREIKKQEGLVDILYPIFKGEKEADTISKSWQKIMVNIPLEQDVVSGNLHLLTAGKREDVDSYFTKVRELDFKDFYRNKNGGEVIEQFRESIKKEFDFILIDSRTGNTDVGNICTAQMPDVLVVLFTAMTASVEGVIETAKRANRNRASLPVERFKMPILPIPTRMDLTERIERDRWLSIFAERFQEIFENWFEVPYKPDATVMSETEYNDVKESEGKFYGNYAEYLENKKNGFYQEQVKKIFSYINIPHFPRSTYEEGVLLDEGDYGVPGTIGFYYLTIAAVLANKLNETEMLFKTRDLFINRVSSRDNSMLETTLRTSRSIHTFELNARLNKVRSIERQLIEIEKKTDDPLLILQIKEFLNKIIDF